MDTWAAGRCILRTVAHVSLFILNILHHYIDSTRSSLKSQESREWQTTALEQNDSTKQKKNLLIDFNITTQHFEIQIACNHFYFSYAWQFSECCNQILKSKART